MTKPRLIYRTQDYPNFSQGWIRPLVEHYFDMSEWNPDRSYDSDVTVLTTYQQDFDADAWFRPLEAAGHKVVVDHLFDSDVDTRSFRIADHKLDLRSGNWMWYHSALSTFHYGYNTYRPQLHYSQDFLCLMNKVRDHRDRVQQDLAPELEHALWSYVERGIEINDPQQRNTAAFWLYYMNPKWYDSTCWHFVVESYMRGDAWFASPQYPNYRCEISEKSYKPLAYFQPFQVLGSHGTLAFLRTQGFETFDNLWSESYDAIESDAARLDHVLQQVRDTAKTYNRHWPGWDQLTQQKLEHNHHRFFDMETVRLRFGAEIMHDILEFISQ